MLTVRLSPLGAGTVRLFHDWLVEEVRAEAV